MQNTAYGPNMPPHLFLQMKFYWITALPICLYRVCSSLCTTTVELSSWDRSHGPQSLKYLLFGSLTEKLCWLLAYTTEYLLYPFAYEKIIFNGLRKSVVFSGSNSGLICSRNLEAIGYFQLFHVSHKVLPISYLRLGTAVLGRTLSI